MSRKYLIFGDSNTDEYIDGAHVERYPGLKIDDEFWFRFDVALDEDLYDKVIVCIGTNEHRDKDHLSKLYGSIKEKINCIIIGPYGDINTNSYETDDGVHYNFISKRKLKNKLVKMITK